MTQFTINTLLSIATLSFVTGCGCGAVFANLRSGVKTSRTQRELDKLKVERQKLLNEKLKLDIENKRQGK